MQIFWVSGPVGKIHTLNLSFKSAMTSIAALAVFLLATGSALQFFGFRLALEYDPQIARQLGNLHTAVELENLNAVYHARLQDLETDYRDLVKQVKELERTKSKLSETLTPPAIQKERPKGTAQGGILIPAPLNPEGKNGSVLDALSQLHRHVTEQNNVLSAEIRAWRAEINWLENMPLGLPVASNQIHPTSGFGERIDPITQRRAVHTGLDFQLPLLSPVYAAGAGVVTFSGADLEYGKTILLRHRNDFSSRYAHANELLVQEGDKVQKGQLIARSGNTGRSTGPHLHFEIMKNGRYVAPESYLAALSGRQPTPSPAQSGN